MIHLIRTIGPLKYHRTWFARTSSFADRFRVISLRQFLAPAPVGFVRKQFHTVHIDLSLSADDLLAGMKKNTVYEVRRAEKEGVQIIDVLAQDRAAGMEAFRIFFNNFAPTKNLSLLSASQVASFGAALSVSGALFEGALLVMHAWLLDPVEGRTRLLYSATAVDSSIDRAVIGRANRFLHYQDLLQHKAAGFRICDLGGVAIDPDKPKTTGIDQFKLGFGGAVVQEDHFDSIPLIAAEKLKAVVAAIKHAIASRLKPGAPSEKPPMPTKPELPSGKPEGHA